MDLAWIHESPAHWDAEKRRVLGGAPAGSLPPHAYADGALLPGDWWRVEREGRVIGYGWMDTTWGDAEILLAVEGGAAGAGVGTFIVERLAEEARARGLGRLYNTVRPGHPAAARVTRWLLGRGFVEGGEGLLARAVPR